MSEQFLVNLFEKIAAKDSKTVHLIAMKVLRSFLDKEIAALESADPPKPPIPPDVT